MTPVMSGKLPVLMTFVITLIAVMCFREGECKTVKSYAPESALETRERKLDNFVEFKEEGDQLAVETTEGSVGKETSVANTGRQCANVQKAVYPVIPVIIASLVGLIGAIIISAIVRLVFRLMGDSKDSGNGSSDYGYGYDRQLGRRTFFGFDLSSLNFGKLAQNVLSAVEKIY